MSVPNKTDDPPRSDDAQLRERNQQAIALLRKWASEPADEDEEFWRDFDAELKEQSLDF